LCYTFHCLRKLLVLAAQPPFTRSNTTASPTSRSTYFGASYLHGTYPNLAAAQLANAIPLPVSPGYTGLTSYYLIPALNLPLLEPLRQLGVPAPIIDLIQPVLRVIVDLGYGTGYANIPTPAGLLPPINLLTLATELLQAGGQGVEDALLDVL